MILPSNGGKKRDDFSETQCEKLADMVLLDSEW